MSYGQAANGRFEKRMSPVHAGVELKKQHCWQRKESLRVLIERTFLSEECRHVHLNSCQRRVKLSVISLYVYCFLKLVSVNVFS